MTDIPSEPAPAVAAAGGAAAPENPFGRALLLLAVVAILFGASLHGGFVYDDLVLIERNPSVTQFAHALRSFWEPHWGFSEPSSDQPVGYWRPLTIVTLALGHLFGGGAPEAFHGLSIALHAIATLLCARLATLLTGRYWLGTLAGLLFAVHPVHVESIAWISAVNDPLYTTFALASICSYVRWRRGGSRGRPVAAALWLIPALLAKEQALCVVPVLAAFDLAIGLHMGDVRDDGEEPSLAQAYVPLLAAYAVYWLARTFVFGSWLGGFDRTSAQFHMDAVRSTQFRLELLGGFLGLLVWPGDLAVFRPVRPVLPPLDPAFFRALCWTAVWIAATAMAWRKRARLELAMLLFVIAALSPILVSYESAGAFPLSDRYLYLPSVGICVLATALARHLSDRRVAGGVLLVVSALLGARTLEHERLWENDEVFFRSAVAASPRSPYVHWGLGRVLLEQYAVRKERPLLDEAFLHYLTSLSLGTDYGEYAAKLPADAPLEERVNELLHVVNETPPEARRQDPTVMVSLDDRLQANIGQGWCYLFLAELSPEHDLDAPLLVFEQTLKAFPDSYHAWTGLGTTRSARGEYEQAREAFDRALKLNPRHAEAWHNLGQTLAREGDWDGARRAFQQALDIRPDDLGDLIGIAKTAIEAGRFEEAEHALRAADRAHPESLEPLFWRGMFEASQRNFPTALERFDQLLAREPDYGDAHLQRGKVLRILGENQEAVRAFGRACELLPTSYEAHYMLAALLLERQGDVSAVPYLIRAYELSERGEQRRMLGDRLAMLVGDDSEQTYRLAVLSERRADWVQALDWIERHLATGTEAGAGRAHHRRGRYLQQLGRADEAVAAYKRALALDPGAFWVNHDLGLLLARGMGRAEEARTYLEQALANVSTLEGADALREAVRRNLESVLRGGEATVGPAPVPIEAQDPPPR